MDELFYLYDYVSSLKNLKRKGWTLRGIQNPESVADHSYAVSVLTMVMAEKLKLDKEKCIKLAIIHDMAESIIGDLTPKDKGYEKKGEIEKKAIKEIVKKTGLTFIEKVWKEYEENKTNEAKLVHDMDKIEMLMQALEYKKRFPDKDLEEFFRYVKDKLYFEESKKIYGKIMTKKLKTQTFI